MILAELIKAYPTQGLQTRTFETYFGAIRDYLLADEDVTAVFDISELEYKGQDAAWSDESAGTRGFRLIPKNISNDTWFAVFDRNAGQVGDFGFGNIYTGGVRFGSQSMIPYNTNKWQKDILLMLIKGDGLIGFAFQDFTNCILFADMLDVNSGFKTNYMFVIPNYNPYWGITGTVISTTYTKFRNMEMMNACENYFLYPLVMNDGVMHKDIYQYDGGNSRLLAGEWMINNRNYISLGRISSGSYSNLLIGLGDENSGSTADLGVKEITENGIYNAEDDSLDGYSSVSVNVPTSASLDEIIIVKNGIYNASDENIDGYSKITVNVPLSVNLEIGTATKEVI